MTIAMIASNVKIVIIAVNATIVRNVILSMIVNALRCVSPQINYLNAFVVKNASMFLDQNIVIIRMILNTVISAKTANNVLTVTNAVAVFGALIAMSVMIAKIVK